VEFPERHELPLQAQKMEVLGRLAGAVIHDLNNLLTVIQLNAGLISLGGLPEEEVLASAGKIDEASCRAAELTRKVLNFARGKADEIGPVNLPELITGLSRLLEPLVAKRVRMEIALGTEERWVRGNSSAIEQAVMNLVLNAVDAMPDGGKVTISCKAQTLSAGERKSCSPGRYIVICVADEGRGIPLEDRTGIFKPFFTTKNDGTGMGLAIVNRIARLHGGVVEFESELGKGTEFRIWLPEDTSVRKVEVRVPVVSAPPSSDRTILLVEDDPGILELTLYLLNSMGLRVLPAKNGEEALAHWQSHREEIGLLFTDIVLPGQLSGRDLALKLLADRPSLPVLYTSGYSNMDADQSYFTKSNFLSKPFQSTALQKAVRAALAETQPA
jgi:CheY-like chemotaxis protein